MLTVRRMLAFAVVVVAAAAATVTVASPTPASAQAEPGCVRNTEVIVGESESGDALLGADVVDTCEIPGGDGSGGGEHTCQADHLGAVPCVDPVMGWWSHTEQCYVRPLSPQPPAGDPQWDEHDPDEGTVYEFHCWAGSLAEWRPSVGFRAEAPEQPSVVELAQQAIETLPLPGPQIGIAPDPSGAGLVGLPVWMWTENEAATWGPVTGEASIPGVVTVTAEAEAARITWDMGDGNTVVCDNPGTPYQAKFGSEPSPTCGHVYAESSRAHPGGRYPITATTDWRVTWWVEPRGSGAESEEALGFLRDETTSVRINELQVVTS